MSDNRVQEQALAQFCHDVLAAAGADAQTASDATRAMMHASIHGVDSHGVRLMPHYARVLRGGRLNGTPNMVFTRSRAGSGTLDADDAHGARAMYAAARHACDLASEAGTGGVGITNSSHFGPARAYAMAMAERGMMGLVFGNSDSFVRLHDGAAKFHGTNPIAVAIPAPENPWLLDMATSSIPVNRVELYKSLGREMPPGTGSKADGQDTNDPHEVDMLAPVGGAYGFKGAALGGVAEIFSAILTGMFISPDIARMDGADISTPRKLGAFVLALDPEAFAGGAAVSAGMAHYLESLRNSPARPGMQVMAPGDREWAEAERRREHGIPLDPVTVEAFRDIAETTGISPLVG